MQRFRTCRVQSQPLRAPSTPLFCPVIPLCLSCPTISLPMERLSVRPLTTRPRRSTAGIRYLRMPISLPFRKRGVQFQRTRVAEAPPLYPALDSVFEKNKLGLLSEDALLSFYKNPLYEQAEDFVDQFIQVGNRGMHINFHRNNCRLRRLRMEAVHCSLCCHDSRNSASRCD